MKEKIVKVRGDKALEYDERGELVNVRALPGARARELSTLKALDLIEFNARAETEFVRLVTELVQRGQPPRVREVLAEAAYELNISVETAKRYLLKHSARRAEFVVEGGFVRRRENEEH